jgi:NTE family protein
MDISLALGGGGSRGHAHIGVLRRLEQEGFRIQAVAGTSAGGIVATAYAAGYTPDELESIFAKLDQAKLFAPVPPEGPGLLGLSRAIKVLEDLYGNRTFAELRIPCAVVAVDIKAGREVVLNQGCIIDAVLGTIAVPGVFPPKQYGDIQLVDGGVMNPVPVSVARSLAPKLPVVAVVLNPLNEQPGNFSRLPIATSVPTQIVERLTRTRIAQTLNIFLSAIDTGSRVITELRLQVDAPEVVVRPDVSGIGLLDQVDVHKVALLGEKALDAVLGDLRRSVSWSKRLRRNLFPQK